MDFFEQYDSDLEDMLELHLRIVVDMDASLSVGEEEQVALFVPSQLVDLKLKSDVEKMKATPPNMLVTFKVLTLNCSSLTIL